MSPSVVGATVVYGCELTRLNVLRWEENIALYRSDRPNSAEDWEMTFQRKPECWPWSNGLMLPANGPVYTRDSLKDVQIPREIALSKDYIKVIWLSPYRRQTLVQGFRVEARLLLNRVRGYCVS